MFLFLFLPYVYCNQLVVSFEVWITNQATRCVIISFFCSNFYAVICPCVIFFLVGQKDPTINHDAVVFYFYIWEKVCVLFLMHYLQTMIQKVGWFSENLDQSVNPNTSFGPALILLNDIPINGLFESWFQSLLLLCIILIHQRNYCNIKFCISYCEWSCIKQFADQVNHRFISQLISGVSRVLQKLRKYFNCTTISIFFVFSAAEVFPVIIVLNLKFWMFFDNYCCAWLDYTPASQHPGILHDILGYYFFCWCSQLMTHNFWTLLACFFCMNFSTLRLLLLHLSFWFPP